MSKSMYSGNDLAQLELVVRAFVNSARTGAEFRMFVEGTTDVEIEYTDSKAPPERVIEVLMRHCRDCSDQATSQHRLICWDFFDDRPKFDGFRLEMHVRQPGSRGGLVSESFFYRVQDRGWKVFFGMAPTELIEVESELGNEHET
jgi:hypothetical protein